LEKIFVIDGSKRSAKLMPISGFSELRNGWLYMTIVSGQTFWRRISGTGTRVGHYRTKHIIYNLISTLTTGFTVAIFHFVDGLYLLSRALGVTIPNRSCEPDCIWVALLAYFHEWLELSWAIEEVWIQDRSLRTRNLWHQHRWVTQPWAAF
jgi:hypothetical protein